MAEVVEFRAKVGQCEIDQQSAISTIDDLSRVIE